MHAIPMLGEFLTRHIPDGHTVRHSDLLAALRGAGLPEHLAGGLSLGQALARVVKDLAAGGLVHNLRDAGGVQRFQLDSKGLDASTNRMLVTWRAEVQLDKGTGAITSTDPAVEAQARAMIHDAQEQMRTADIVRVVVRVVAHECGGRVFSKGGSTVQFFIPDRYHAATDVLERFLGAIGCSLTRVPVVDIPAVQALLDAHTTTPVATAAPAPPHATEVRSVVADCGIPAVVDAVTDGLLYDIRHVDEIVARLRVTTRESTVAKECARLLEIADYAETVRGLIGCRVEIVRDHAALARMRLRQLYAAVQADAAEEMATVSPPLPFDGPAEEEDMPAPTTDAEGRVRYPRVG